MHHDAHLSVSSTQEFLTPEVIEELCAPSCLHSFGWNRPEFCIEIDLCPPSTGSLRRTYKGQGLKLNKTASRNRKIRYS